MKSLTTSLLVSPGGREKMHVRSKAGDRQAPLQPQYLLGVSGHNPQKDAHPPKGPGSLYFYQADIST